VLIIVLRNRLIDALNSNLTLTPSNPSLALPSISNTLSSELPSLQRTDYLHIKHWTRRRGDKAQVTVIKVTDTNSIDSDNDNLESDDPSSSKDDGIPAFLEDENGTLITYEEKKQLYLAMRGWWNDKIDIKNPPINWSSTGESLRSSFRNFLERKFFYLRLCSHHWKVDELWKRNYHSWRRSRLNKTMDSDDSTSDERPSADISNEKKRKRKSKGNGLNGKKQKANRLEGASARDMKGKGIEKVSRNNFCVAYH